MFPAEPITEPVRGGGTRGLTYETIKDLKGVMQLDELDKGHALILVQTVGGGHRIVLDARAPAVTVAAALAWRRAPFLVVVLAAAGTAALVRVLV